MPRRRLIWCHLDFGIRYKIWSNDRVGRFVMFKECLMFGVIPFLISDGFKMFYYHELQ